MNWVYEDFTRAIFRLTGINLSYYKERQMKRRIDSLISRSPYNQYYTYYNALTENDNLLETFVNYITINVSEFYRNPNQWEVLEKDILPPLLRKHRQLRIWSAACSSGEEPYSMVMLLNKFLPLENIRILATDIDKEILIKAQEGKYQEKNLQSLPQEFVKKYFRKERDLYVIDDRIKERVDFRRHNLLKDPYPNGCHLIICRNVMIYFTEEAKGYLYSKFKDSLDENGILFVGSTEQIIFPQRYGLKSIKTFFYKKVPKKS